MAEMTPVMFTNEFERDLWTRTFERKHSEGNPTETCGEIADFVLRQYKKRDNLTPKVKEE